MTTEKPKRAWTVQISSADPEDEANIEYEDNIDGVDEEDELDEDDFDEHEATFCTEHGWGVEIDEEGCCIICGGTAVGTAVDAMALFLEDLECKSHEICCSVLHVKDLVSTLELVDEEELDDKPMADA